MRIKSKLIFFYKIVVVVKNPKFGFNRLIGKELDFSKIPLERIINLIGEPKVVVEAGAADGVDTEIFNRKFPNCAIHALEPVPQQFDFLRKKFQHINNISLYNIAFSSKDGSASMNIGSSLGNLGGMGSSSLLEPTLHREMFPQVKFDSAPITVETKSLESFLKGINETTIDLLWLDIQGEEYEVLRSSARVVQERVKSIHLEISRFQLYSDAPKPAEIRRLLKELNFQKAIYRVGAVAGNAFYINKRFL